MDILGKIKRTPRGATLSVEYEKPRLLNQMKLGLTNFNRLFVSNYITKSNKNAIIRSDIIGKSYRKNNKSCFIY